MHLYTRNVNTAFRELVEIIESGGMSPRDSTHDVSVARRQSRNGDVLMIDEPVTITYSHPRERVLFNQARDANPFFHLYHVLWMLVGRNDVAPVAHYIRRVREFSDDGVTLNGAYGHRWRHAGVDPSLALPHERIDQLGLLVAHLKADPQSRRAVLQMWNVEDDLLKIGRSCGKCDGGKVRDNVAAYPCPDCRPASKDVCCNLSVMFSLRDGPRYAKVGEEDNGCSYLDMTVTNRSNDLVWGMLGEDYVTFTVLQEYMAARLGAEVGKYHHFTNNLHVYDWNWRPDEWLSWEWSNGPGFEYDAAGVMTVPLVVDPAAFVNELPILVETAWGEPHKIVGEVPNLSITEPFLHDVAGRLFVAHALHRLGDDHGAMAVLAEVPADDWRVAAEGWVRRRTR